MCADNEDARVFFWQAITHCRLSNHSVYISDLQKTLLRLYQGRHCWVFCIVPMPMSSSQNTTMELGRWKRDRNVLKPTTHQHTHTLIMYAKTKKKNKKIKVINLKHPWGRAKKQYGTPSFFVINKSKTHYQTSLFLPKNKHISI